MKFLYQVAVSLACSVTLLTCASASAATTEPQACYAATLHEVTGMTGPAVAAFKACYEDPAATTDLIIYARFHRATLLMKDSRTEEALSEFESLLSPAFTASTIWDRRVSGKEKLGATRGLIAAQVARIALTQKDTAKALTFAELALREGRKDIATQIDVLAEAYMIRGRIRAERGDNPKATADLIRAYVRGSDDAWVVANVKDFGAEDLARIEDLHTRATKAYATFWSYFPASGGFIKMDETLARERAAGDAVYSGVASDEAAMLGPDIMDTEG